MTGVSAGLRWVSDRYAREKVQAELVSRDQLARHSGVLRTCVWSLSSPERPAHTLKILNLAVAASIERLALSDGDAAALRVRLRDLLDELASVGDLISLPDGAWLPAPCREVRLPSGTDERLIVGGIPSSVLPKTLSSLLREEGPLRRTSGTRISEALGLPTEALEVWLGRPPRDLQLWAQKVMGVDLEPYVESGEASPFEVYSPGTSRPFSPQGFRWCEPAPAMSGRYLARREVAFRGKQSRIVELRAGRLTGSAVPKTALGDIRRLMYALDSAVNKPTRVRWVIRQDAVEMELQSEVPRAEQRLFAALGHLEVDGDRYYPRMWRFSLARWDAVQERLSELGIASERLIGGRVGGE